MSAMSLRQQIVEDEVDRVASLLELPEDLAFLRFVHHLLTGRSLHVFDDDDLVDGGQDKQIDAIIIDSDDSAADVWIIQAKASPSFSSNVLVQMANGLKWLMQAPRKDLDTLDNTAFRDKILEFRSVRSDLGPSNLRLHVAFATLGSTKNLSKEFEQELEVIRDTYSDDVFESFDIRAYGHDELNELLKARDRRSNSIDADLKIRYDVNKGSVINYRAEDLRGLVCTVSAQEIARIVNEDTSGTVFDLNLRQFLRSRSAVNKDIMETCTSPKTAHEFWFLNNGVTIVCDGFDPNLDPDDPRVKLKNLQIVNGCQTASTLAAAQKEGTLRPDVRVMARIYETPKTGLVDKIVLTTNNQNRISSRDLRANDAVQVDMERGFAIYGMLYERKQRQHDSKAEDQKKIVPNEAVGQWYLAVVLKNPADGRGRKYKVWGELYDKIFAGKQSIEPYVIAVLLGRRVAEWIDASGLKNDPEDDVKRMLAKRGALHVGRIAAFLWKGDDRWDEPQQSLAERIRALTTDDGTLDDVIERAFELLEQIIRNGDGFAEDMDRALKSYALDEVVNKTLYTRHPAEADPAA
jgi:hypothetical protein